MLGGAIVSDPVATSFKGSPLWIAYYTSESDPKRFKIIINDVFNVFRDFDSAYTSIFLKMLIFVQFLDLVVRICQLAKGK